MTGDEYRPKEQPSDNSKRAKSGLIFIGRRTVRNGASFTESGE